MVLHNQNKCSLKNEAMKKYFYTPVLVALLTSFMTLRAQDRQEYLGLPGDNLNLFAVMNLFQESETLEGFERSLNDPELIVNNLDLNGDKYVDYIRVIDNMERNVHFIVLQVAINPRENQDVAVFTVVQEKNGSVFVQLVGDEELYGKDYIVEPIIDETPNPGYMGQKVNVQQVNVVRTTTYEIAAWPVIHFIFAPSYVVWRSPWYWNYYPSYWRPWNAHYWHYYYGYHYNYYGHYYGHYRYWNHHRYNHYHNVYHAHHYVHSPSVRTRINDGYYKTTYSRPDQRTAGAEMYTRKRQADTPRTNVTSSGGRRNSSGTVSTSSPARGSSTSVSGRRTSGSSGTSVKSTSGSGRSTTSSGTRVSTGTKKPATSSGTRVSSGTQRPTSSSGTRVSGNTTTKSSGQTVRSGSGNTRTGSGESVKTNTRSSSDQTVRSSSGTATRSSGQRVQSNSGSNKPSSSRPATTVRSSNQRSGSTAVSRSQSRTESKSTNSKTTTRSTRESSTSRQGERR